MAEAFELLKEMECSACKECMIPPISLCVEGHSVCFDCRNNISTCPTCKQIMSGSRNYSLENIANKILISCTEGIMNAEDLWEDIECLVCLQYMTCNILLCLKGHSLCFSCRKDVSTCPTCRENMTNSRNYSLEKIVKKIPISCIYKSEGCTKMLPYNEQKIHEKNCLYGPIIVSCKTINCLWTGQIGDLKNHWQSKKFNIKPVSEFYTMIFSINKENHNYIILAEACKRLFWFQLIKDKRNYIKWGVQSIRKQHDVCTYFFQVKFTDQNAPEREIVFSQYCSEIGEDIFSKENSITVPINILSDYINKDKLLSLSLCVKMK